MQRLLVLQAHRAEPLTAPDRKHYTGERGTRDHKDEHQSQRPQQLGLNCVPIHRRQGRFVDKRVRAGNIQVD